MLKQKRGITLVALVVTIIILLILAGVSINMVFGEKGIFSKTQLAAEKYQQAQNDEQKMLNEIQTIESYTKNGTISAEDIAFTPNDSTWTGITNVKQALDYLYSN